ncbi:MAG TPA: helix-turn-helix transcriptional regulator [Rudaea sp.]|jgi:transcriptional regulator with XRE-family HTH domain|uniref:helix-turn-helix domain-containing protein n=1 Tax=Rudaea sp. TaxID=2136325 RepID=UPI002F91C455
MKIGSETSDSTALRELGARIAAVRLTFNLTQAQLAEQAGISKRTVERLESGAVATQLSAFLRVLRVLRLQDRIELLVPESTPGPVAQLQLKGRTRKRASGQTQEQTATTKKWAWEP